MSDNNNYRVENTPLYKRYNIKPNQCANSLAIEDLIKEEKNRINTIIKS